MTGVPMTVTDARTVEERLAALEAVLFPQPPEWTDAEIAEFRSRWAEISEHHEVRLLPPGPALLTPALARQLLRECVTVVKPGEVLVLRSPEDWTADQAMEMQRYANQWLEDNATGVKLMVVPHLEMTVVQPEDDAEFAKRVERVWPDLMHKEAERSQANRPRTA